MALHETFINLVKNSLDISICNTGYPVTAEVISRAKLATRRELRILERRGHIQSITIHVQRNDGGHQLHKAYYTKNELPKAFMKDFGFETGPDGALIKKDRLSDTVDE